MLKEFKEFAMRGNVIDLAIAFVMGAAFGKIVTSVVNDIVMPLLSPLMPGATWRTLEIGPGVKIGSFLATTLDFIVIAFAVFLIVRTINRLKKKEEEKPLGPADLPPDVKLLTEIRDMMRNRKNS